MPKLPVLKPLEVVSRLEALGFIEVRQRGAHKQFQKEGVGLGFWFLLESLASMSSTGEMPGRVRIQFAIRCQEPISGTLMQESRMSVPDTFFPLIRGDCQPGRRHPAGLGNSPRYARLGSKGESIV